MNNSYDSDSGYKMSEEENWTSNEKNIIIKNVET